MIRKWRNPARTDQTLLLCSARHRLRDQVPGNQRQVEHQRGRGESGSEPEPGGAAERRDNAPISPSGLPEPRQRHHEPTLQEDGEPDPVQRSRPPGDSQAAVPDGAPCLSLQNDGGPAGGGEGQVKISEPRSKKSLFRCTLL